ncbi:aminopeptidase P family protein [Denitrobaculum tricleocarpae]|uniref:Aminopeptidase P family protein n=1 Tax=Denitrobaculum tricleocarpae TaxID=2591009 RepID=A0A545TRW8_9PROT|nr:aminopeptidase P family protein [Denitrobaculum tricleocarpae]
MRPAPERGFPESEFEARLQAAQRLMSVQRMSALLLSTEPEVRYFSGFLTQFWQSPTRPWFLVIPAKGKPIAVVPAIGADVMARTWVEDIRTWSSPRPEDDGITLLTTALRDSAGATGRIGVPMGPETHLRMPLGDFDKIRKTLHGNDFVDATGILRSLRMVKSDIEVEKIQHICGVVSSAFEALPELLSDDQTEIEAFRTFKTEILRRGGDDVPYLVGGAGQGGYEDIISPPTNRRLQQGDLLMLDTGAVFDGYFCDFDRNFWFGKASDQVRRAYDTVYAATQAGFRAARPGATTSDLFQAMWRALEDGGALGNDVGRLGHGLGMQLTEWPSNTATDGTLLVPNMVLTLEPGMTFAPGKQMVHEENIVIRDGGAEWLTRRAPAELPEI